MIKKWWSKIVGDYRGDGQPDNARTDLPAYVIDLRDEFPERYAQKDGDTMFEDFDNLCCNLQQWRNVDTTKFISTHGTDSLLYSVGYDDSLDTDDVRYLVGCYEGVVIDRFDVPNNTVYLIIGVEEGVTQVEYPDLPSEAVRRNRRRRASAMTHRDNAVRMLAQSTGSSESDASVIVDSIMKAVRDGIIADLHEANALSEYTLYSKL